MPPIAVLLTADVLLMAGTARPGACAMLEALDAQGVPTAVLASDEPAGMRSLLETLELIPDALVTAGDGLATMPAPDLIFRACEVLGVAPWEVLVVGGSDFDKHAAATAGALFAGIDGVAGNFTITNHAEVLAIVDGTHP